MTPKLGDLKQPFYFAHNFVDKESGKGSARRSLFGISQEVAASTWVGLGHLRCDRTHKMALWCGGQWMPAVSYELRWAIDQSPWQS